MAIVKWMYSNYTTYDPINLNSNQTPNVVLALLLVSFKTILIIFVMSSVNIASTIAKRSISTLLYSTKRQDGFTAKVVVGTANKCRWVHSMEKGRHPSMTLRPLFIDSRSVYQNLFSTIPSAVLGTPSPQISIDFNLSFGSIRSYSPTVPNNRKGGSRMGHHVQNLQDMAHEESREEARNRREEKRKKSKKARVAALKENTSDDSDDDFAGEDEDENLGPNEDELGNPLLPDASAVKSKMLMVVASLERSFSSIRGGEATAELFDNVKVSAYGEIVPLSSLGQVVIEDPQRATISCYDPSVVNDVRDAIRDMPGMNLNPYAEEGGSGVVIIPIPRVSEETRKEIVKELGRQAENGRQRVRKIRRDAMDVVKKGKDGKLEGISKDDAFRTGKDVDAVTEEVLAVLNEIVDKKQKSVMED
ncbi:hypothetical protein ACHAXS_005340 [Conticribra weissflogii]